MPLLPSYCTHTAALHAWQGRAAWHLLCTQFDQGQVFLAAWTAWQADAQRSAQLHVTAVVTQTVTAADVLAHAPAAQPALAQALAAQLYGLLPGVHRLSFAQGRVLLTLWVGEVQDMLRHQHSVADAVWLPAPFASDSHSVKALARHCKRGTVLQMPQADARLQRALESAGFVVAPPMPVETTHFEAADAAPAHPLTQAHYAPRWEPRQRGDAPAPVKPAGTALVVGAGLAGSAIAHSLALRGWQVTVLMEGAAPADGASGLPAGLFCPHVSPDDSVLSRLSRNGVRMTLQRLQDVCTEGTDWGHSGVLEHCTDGGTGLPAAWAGGPGADWSRPATSAELAQAGLPADTVACWHAQAGWVRPAQLVRAQLQHPNIRCIPNTLVHQLRALQPGTATEALPTLQTSHTLQASKNWQASPWQALDAQGRVLASADIAVLAAGPATAHCLPAGVHWPLQNIRGQITQGPHTDVNAAALPPFSVNGNGNLVTHVPLPEGKTWVMGSTFERDTTQMPISAADQMAAHAVNYDKLSSLLPASAAPLRPWFTPGHAHCQPTWGRVRVASHDRLPIAGPVSPAARGLWALTALGARGLTLSVLCGELIAARLHGEPLPLDAKLAQHLGTERLVRQGHKAGVAPLPEN